MLCRWAAVNTLAAPVMTLLVFSVLFVGVQAQTQCAGVYTDASNPNIKHSVWHADHFSVNTGIPSSILPLITASEPKLLHAKVLNSLHRVHGFQPDQSWRQCPTGLG